VPLEKVPLEDPRKRKILGASGLPLHRWDSQGSGGVSVDAALASFAERCVEE